MDLTPFFFLFFFFLFWWNKSQTWEIHQPTNYSHHFPIWIQKTLLGKIVQEENQLSFTTLLHPWNFQYFQLQMMDPSSSIPSNHPWMTIESPMEAKYINYLSLSLAFVLCLLSIDYWLLVSSFLFHFFFFISLFHTYAWYYIFVVLQFHYCKTI